MDDEDAPSSNDATRPWPSALRHANDREHDAELANVLSRTEIMVARFYKEGHLTLKLGQLFLDTVRHPLFDVKELRSETIVHLLRRLERPSGRYGYSGAHLQLMEIMGWKSAVGACCARFLRCF